MAAVHALRPIGRSPAFRLVLEVWVGSPTTRMQDAVRILMLIDNAVESVTETDIADDAALETAVGVVRTQVRLQKLDFWVRNPDYLANELLNDFENGDRDTA